MGDTETISTLLALWGVDTPQSACNVDLNVFFIINRLNSLLRPIEFQVAWDDMALTWYVIVLNWSGL